MSHPWKRKDRGPLANAIDRVLHTTVKQHDSERACLLTLLAQRKLSPVDIMRLTGLTKREYLGVVKQAIARYRAALRDAGTLSKTLDQVAVGMEKQDRAKIRRDRHYLNAMRRKSIL
jgi:hypothetical protein